MMDADEEVRRKLRERCDLWFSDVERLLTGGEETNNDGHEK